MKKIKISILCISFLSLALSTIVLGKEADQIDLLQNAFFTEEVLSEDVEFIGDLARLGATEKTLWEYRKDNIYGISLKVYYRSIGNNLSWDYKKNLLGVKGEWKPLEPGIVLSDPKVSYGCSDDRTIERGEREPKGDSFAYYTNFDTLANVRAKNYFSGLRVTLKVTNEITGESYEDVVQLNERNQNLYNRIF